MDTKVICVDASGLRPDDPLRKGGVYRVHSESERAYWLDVQEGEALPYYKWRFRLADADAKAWI
jgi:hypothetical protein